MTIIQKTDLLLAMYIGAIVCAELLGSKVFTAWGINASVSIFIIPLTYSINDVIFEVHGEARARSFAQSGWWMLVGLFAFNALALVLPPAQRFASSNQAYSQVFSTSMRIIIASLSSFWLSERLDIYVFAQLRRKLQTQGLWLRNNVSNIVSELLDTVIFMFLAFYVPGHFWFIVSLIVPYWILKCVVSALDTPLTYAGVAWLKSEHS